MDYFWIRQDRRYLNPPVIDDFNSQMRRRDFTVENSYKIPDRNVVYCDTEKQLDFIDVLDSQLFLVSEKVKQVFQLYAVDIKYKFFCLINNMTGEYKNYYVPIFEPIDAVIDHKLIRNEKIILRKKAIEESIVFRVDNENEDIVIIRLDVAESLLRRGLTGVRFTRATVINK